jgi:hypothetical protein
MGGNFIMDIVGIAVGHAVYYSEVLYPFNHNGKKLVPTPQFVKDWFAPQAGLHGTSGPIPQAAQPRTQSTWGPGHRLGSN